MTHYFVNILTEEESGSLVEKNMSYIRRILFSRALRLLPLSAQVGIVEGLSCLLKSFPASFSLSDDQHLMSFLSELLKLASVADGEMTDKALVDCVVDKNGYSISNGKVDARCPTHPSHASAVFLRRGCVFTIAGMRLVCPEELPAGVQLRVAGITLLHSVIKTYSDTFFDAEAATPIGKSIMRTKLL